MKLRAMNWWLPAIIKITKRKHKSGEKTSYPIFWGSIPSKYVKLYFSSYLIIFAWFLWAANHNYSTEQVDDFLSLIYIPISVGFMMIPILYTIHFIFYRGALNRSGDFIQISTQNNLEYQGRYGAIISDIREIIDSYPFFSIFFGFDLPPQNYIIQKISDPKFYMFDYGYPIYAKSIKYTFYKTVFILDCSDLDLPSFQIKPTGLFDLGVLIKNIFLKVSWYRSTQN